MIKKPKPLTIPDILRLAKDKKQAAIEKNNQEFRDYENYVLTELVKEFGTASIGELLFCLVEKYHPKLKIKASRGAKTKWNDYLCSMVAIEIDSRRNPRKPLKAVVNDLCKHPIWGRFVEDISGGGQEQFKKVYKVGKKAKTLEFAKRMHATSENWEEEVKAELRSFLKSR